MDCQILILRPILSQIGRENQFSTDLYACKFSVTNNRETSVGDILYHCFKKRVGLGAGFKYNDILIGIPPQ